MWVVTGEKNGKWIGLITEHEVVTDTLIEGLEKDGYSRISVSEEQDLSTK
jgi:hypothetical protein